jgi:hypothetical protein
VIFESVTPRQHCCRKCQLDAGSSAPGQYFRYLAGGQILSRLQQIQQQDPAQFQQMATTIAGRLQQAAENAKSQGNTSQADQLNKLADLFQNAASSGQVPSAQALQQAGLSGHHHHHGGHHSHSGSQSSQTDPLSHFQSQTTGANTPDLTAIFGSVINGTGTGTPTL